MNLTFSGAKNGQFQKFGFSKLDFFVNLTFSGAKIGQFQKFGFSKWDFFVNLTFFRVCFDHFQKKQTTEIVTFFGDLTMKQSKITKNGNFTSIKLDFCILLPFLYTQKNVLKMIRMFFSLRICKWKQLLSKKPKSIRL